jgi:hypothetical protein
MFMLTAGMNGATNHLTVGSDTMGSGNREAVLAVNQAASSGKCLDAALPPLPLPRRHRQREVIARSGRNRCTVIDCSCLMTKFCCACGCDQITRLFA